MQCRTHPDRVGVNTCNQCGEWICDACTVEINGRIFCRRCLAQLAAEPTAPPSPPPALAPGYYYAPRPVSGRHVSWGLLFLFSVVIPVPGLNYMYEGLIKRGLAAMTGFFMLIYLVSTFHMWPFGLIFGLAMPVYMLACIFDGFHIQRRLNAGEAVNDNVDDILGFLRRNRSLLIGALLLVVGLAAVGALTDWFGFYRPFRSLLPVLVIGLGLYMLIRSPSRHGKHHRRHGRSHMPPYGTDAAAPDDRANG